MQLSHPPLGGRSCLRRAASENQPLPLLQCGFREQSSHLRMPSISTLPSRRSSTGRRPSNSGMREAGSVSPTSCRPLISPTRRLIGSGASRVSSSRLWWPASCRSPICQAALLRRAMRRGAIRRRPLPSSSDVDLPCLSSHMWAQIWNDRFEFLQLRSTFVSKSLQSAHGNHGLLAYRQRDIRGQTAEALIAAG